MIRFFIEDDFEKAGHLYNVAEYSMWIPIPFSEYTLSPIPNSVTLRPGETGVVDLQVVSHTAHENNLLLGTHKLNGINANFLTTGTNQDIIALPNQKVTVTPGDSERVLLRVGAEYNVDTPNFYLLPISAKIFNSEGHTNQYELPLPITTQTILNITVLKPITSAEKFSMFWNTYGGAISLVGAGFVGGFSAYVFDYLKNRGQKKEQPDNNK
jgi:hypothetical protein